MITNKSDAFFCLKLVTNETIFAELIDVDEHAMTVLNPMLVITKVEEMDETVSMVPWVPYVKRTQIPIPLKMVFFADNLNADFFDYYGRVVLQSEINKIKQRVYRTMIDGNDYVTMCDGLAEMKTVANQLSTKFGVPAPDFSDFEVALEKFKSNMSIH